MISYCGLSTILGENPIYGIKYSAIQIYYSYIFLYICMKFQFVMMKPHNNGIKCKMDLKF